MAHRNNHHDGVAHILAKNPWDEDDESRSKRSSEVEPVRHNSRGTTDSARSDCLGGARILRKREHRQAHRRSRPPRSCQFEIGRARRQGKGQSDLVRLLREA